MTDNKDGLSRFSYMVDRVGFPGTLLIMICVGLYFGAVQPLVAVASEHVSAQTSLLAESTKKLNSVLTVVEADKAERKSEKLSSIEAMLERHDQEMIQQMERQTVILEKLSDIIEDQARKDGR